MIDLYLILCLTETDETVKLLCRPWVATPAAPATHEWTWPFLRPGSERSGRPSVAANRHLYFIYIYY